MIDQRERAARPYPRKFSQQIVDRTDGVPLFIEELTKVRP